MDVHVYASLCRVIVTQIATQLSDHPLRTDQREILGATRTARCSPTSPLQAAYCRSRPSDARVARALAFRIGSRTAARGVTHRACSACADAVVGAGGVLVVCVLRACCVLVVARSRRDTAVIMPGCRGRRSPQVNSSSPGSEAQRVDVVTWAPSADVPGLQVCLDRVCSGGARP
jgi:hypothetical protein